MGGRRERHQATDKHKLEGRTPPLKLGAPPHRPTLGLVTELRSDVQTPTIGLGPVPWTYRLGARRKQAQYPGAISFMVLTISDLHAE